MAMDWMIRAATSRMTVRGGGKPVQAPVFNSDSASRRKAIAGRRGGAGHQSKESTCSTLPQPGASWRKAREQGGVGHQSKARYGQLVTGQINHPMIQMVTVEEVFNIHVTACVRA